MRSPATGTNRPPVPHAAICSRVMTFGCRVICSVPSANILRTHRMATRATNAPTAHALTVQSRRRRLSALGASPTLLPSQANGGPLDHCWSVEWGSARHDMLFQKHFSRFGISIVGNNVANYLADRHLQRVR